ncbi:MAG TPA: hypothetical protein PLZ32_08560, partial [Saprospiraceae bacterium]|nr:hypothetical protein [Saprospiraceae bacterium]
LIKERSANAISYEEYLRRIAELAKQVNSGKDEETPTRMDTKGKRALYNNLSKNEELAIRLDSVIRTKSPADWRGNKAKENMIKRCIYDVLIAENNEYGYQGAGDNNDVYKIEHSVEKIFDIIKEQSEY